MGVDGKDIPYDVFREIVDSKNTVIVPDTSEDERYLIYININIFVLLF